MVTTKKTARTAKRATKTTLSTTTPTAAKKSGVLGDLGRLVDKFKIPGIDVAVTRTPGSGSPSALVTLPRMTSVCAAAGVAAMARVARIDRKQTPTGRQHNRREARISIPLWIKCPCYARRTRRSMQQLTRSTLSFCDDRLRHGTVTTGVPQEGRAGSVRDALSEDA